MYHNVHNVFDYVNIRSTSPCRNSIQATSGRSSGFISRNHCQKLIECASWNFFLWHVNVRIANGTQYFMSKFEIHRICLHSNKLPSIVSLNGPEWNLVINLTASFVACVCVRGVVLNLRPLIITALNGDELPNYNCFNPEERWFDISFLWISITKRSETANLCQILPFLLLLHWFSKYF
jgi:hypothetical protein